MNLSRSIVSYKEWYNALDRQCALAHREMRDVCISIIEADDITFEINFDTLRKSDLVSKKDKKYYIFLPECGIDESIDTIARCFENTNTNDLLSANAMDGLIAKVASWDHSEDVDTFIKRAISANIPTEINIYVANKEIQPSKQVIVGEE